MYIPSGGISGVVGALCCGIHGEVGCWMVSRFKVGFTVIYYQWEPSLRPPL